MPKFDGVMVKLGGDEYVIPPLNFRQLKIMFPLIEELNNQTEPMKRMENVVKLAHAALSRNYEDMTIERVEELIDMGNLKAVSEAIMGVSGFVARGER
jgi:hypothetical protein